MPKSFNTIRTLDEWYALVTEARQSGLTDAEWCRRNSISRDTFNNAIKRLRKKAFALPNRFNRDSAPDITTTGSVPLRQEVVRVGVMKPETLPDCTSRSVNPLLPADSGSIEISLSNARIRISNGADPYLVSRTIAALRSCL